MALFMETTQIDAERTAQEIKKLLVGAGATDIYEKYENKKISALSFQLDIDGKPVPFTLPIRTSPVFELMKKGRSRAWLEHWRFKEKHKQQLIDQAERVAWRQILRWLQAQVALIETGMVQAQEVFMPYHEVAPGVTLFTAIQNRRIALPAYGGEDG